jgi:tetratricopeptide (TPR) repeat protein
MPRSSTTDIPHAAITDHRLLRHPSEITSSTNDGLQKVVIWRDGPSAVHTRNFGLAQTVIGFSKNLPDISTDGIRTLKALPAEQQGSDPTVLTALEGFALQGGETAEAVRLGRRVVELQGQSAKAALNLGIVLKRSGDLVEAERQLRRAIDLNPSLKQAYIELAQLYASQRQMQEAVNTIDRFLKWNSQDIIFRLQRARLGTQP